MHLARKEILKHEEFCNAVKTYIRECLDNNIDVTDIRKSFDLFVDGILKEDKYKGGI